MLPGGGVEQNSRAVLICFIWWLLSFLPYREGIVGNGLSISGYKNNGPTPALTFSGMTKVIIENTEQVTLSLVEIGGKIKQKGEACINGFFLVVTYE